MSKKAQKIGLTVVVLALAFGTLLYSSLGESLQQYKYVDEVMMAPAEWHGKALRVHGFVKAGSIERRENTVEHRFFIERNGKVMRAYFNGSPVDQFKDHSEVVLTGVLKDDGFHASDMTAKCPSKYEERPPVTGL